MHLLKPSQKDHISQSNMIFTSSALALTLIALLPSTIASPIEKRFNNAKIRSGQSNLCLSTTPKDGPADGTLLYLRDCKSASTSTWKITPGYGSVILANSGVTVKTFALDAGVPQVNNARPKIMTSTPGVTQQS